MIRTFYCYFDVSAPAVISLRTTAASSESAPTFHRPETKGAKYEMSAKVSIHRTIDYMRDDERHPGPGAENLEVTLDGTLEVTQVTPKAGAVSGYTFTVKGMELTSGQEGGDGLEPGTIITAKSRQVRDGLHRQRRRSDRTLREGLREALPRFTGMDESVDETFAPLGPFAPRTNGRRIIRGLQRCMERLEAQHWILRKRRLSPPLQRPRNSLGHNGHRDALSGRRILQKSKTCRTKRNRRSSA